MLAQSTLLWQSPESQRPSRVLPPLVQVVENPYAPPPAAELKGRLPSEVVLYQYEVCPFCCKVKAFLDYHKVGQGRAGRDLSWLVTLAATRLAALLFASVRLRPPSERDPRTPSSISPALP